MSTLPAEALPVHPQPHSDRPGWRRDVGLFLTGQTVSLLGSSLVQFALMWYLAIETKSGLVLGLAAVAGLVPQAIVSVFGGAWADRVNRKTLIVLADASIAVATLGLAIAMSLGAGALWLVLVALAVRAAGAGIQAPAVSAMIPQLVPARHLIRVNGFMGTVQSAMSLVVPALAGVLYAVLPLQGILLIDVVTAVVGILLISRIVVGVVPRGSGKPAYLRDLADGFRYVASDRFVRWVIVVCGGMVLFGGLWAYLTPLLVTRSFTDEPWLLATTQVAVSVGAILGGILLTTTGGLRNRMVMVLLNTIVFSAMLVALGLATEVWLFVTLMLTTGFATPFFMTPIMTLLQERVEPERQGRVFGAWGIVVALAIPVGMAIFGPLADVVAVETLLVAAGAACFAVTAVAFGIPAGRWVLREGSRAGAHPGVRHRPDR